jgi:predicted nucleic acid-binding protein
MPYLADTNILLHWVQPHSPDHALAVKAVRNLHARGEVVSVVPQNIIEFWSIATRPREAVPPGLGLTVEEVAAEVRTLESLFPVLRDTPVIYDEWLRLVVSVGVISIQAHDARIVAAMRMHGLTHILTFNPSHFGRFPGITAVHPQNA